MVHQAYEIVFLGDFRIPFFQTEIVDQIEAVIATGYRTGLVQIASSQASLPARVHPRLGGLIESDRLIYLDPDQIVSSKLAIATDPACFAYKFRRPLRIDAQHTIVLVPSLPSTNSGHEPYSWTTVYRHANEVFSGDVFWAPASPIIRERLNKLHPKPRLSEVDWPPCIEPETWRTDRAGFCASKPIIGRSAFPSDQAWPHDPNQILSLYPDDPQFSVRLLDVNAELTNTLGYYPRNWEMLSKSDIGEEQFLSSIDFFVYGSQLDFDGQIDPHILRAMASGAVAILPPPFEEIFGEGAVYADSHEVRSTVWHLFSNRIQFLDVSEAGVGAIRSRFSFEGLRDRISSLIGDPGSKNAGETRELPPTKIDHAPHDKRRAMFITINGVGMGHLTRMLAIAKRCPPSIEPVFVTMSQALKVLREQGYLAEFIPSRQYLDCDVNQWNRFLSEELNEMIAFYEPTVVIFDGNVPYQGVIEAIKSNPDPWFVWSRRGMWRSENEDIVGREKHFDLVLEPGDLAGTDDHGITMRYQDRTHHVSPIRLLDSSEMLPRDEARLELGMSLEKPAVLIQLGAGNNYDYGSIHKTALGHIDKQYDAEIAVGEWLISDKPIDLPDRAYRMPGYPFARYFNAFDFAVSAVGYNSFHELLFAGIPTIFVANENMQQDNQLARALYADRHGLAICVRANEIYRLTSMIDKLFRSDERDLMKSRLAELDPSNGAAEAAALINELAYSRRVTGYSRSA